MIILFVALFGSFLFRSYAVEDPDFGWHLQTGKLILEKGIPITDPFSYTMPSYYFVDHEWLSDVLIFKAYEWGELIPLHLFFAVTALGALLVLLLSTEKRRGGIVVFLAGGTLLEFIGIRMQVLTWFFLALLCSLLYNQDLWKKYRFAVPFLFLLWANLHGGFAIGLIVLAIMLVGRFIEERNFRWSDYLILIVSGIATCINPYGYHLWGEVVKSVTDTSLRWTIQEWYPAIYFTNIAFWIYFMVSGLLVFRYRKKFSITILFLYVFLLFSGLASMRNLPIFVIVSFYPTVKAISYLAQEAAKFQYGRDRFGKSYTIFFIMSLCLFLPQVIMFFYSVLSQGPNPSGYPHETVRYLRQHMPTGNIFASYDIGGFLIWQLPEKKVFIDGRMPSWKNESASTSESTYAFADYRSILSNKLSFAEISDKYGIDTVLFPVDQTERKTFQLLGFNVEKSAFLKRFFTNELSFSYLLPQLKVLGWREVYRDKQMIIFQKPDKGS